MASVLLLGILVGTAGNVEALQVVDAEGHPVAAARVEIFRAPPAGGQDLALFHQLAPPILSTDTDSKGRVTSPLPVLETMLLLVDHPSHGPWVQEIRGAPPASVLLSAGLELHGEVDLDGETVRDGEICAGWSTSWRGRKELHRWRRCSAISQDGKVVLRGLADAETRFAVWVPGYVPYRRALHPARTDPLKIRLQPGHRLAGRVEALQQPIRGAIIRSSGGVKETTTADGTFELTVAALPTQLTVEAPGFRRKTIRAGRLPEQRSDLLEDSETFVIELEPAEQISGVVLDFDGRPLKKPTIRVIRVTGETDRETRHRVDTEDGGFRLDLPGPGRYRFLVEAKGRRTEHLPEVYLAPGQIQDVGVVTLSRGAGMVGTLVDGSSDEPIPGALVRALPQGTRIFDTMRRGEALRGITDETGRFELWGLDAGRYDLRPEHDGYAPVSFPVALERDEVADLAIVPLEPGARVSGTLLDREGRPRPGLRVRVQDPEQASLEPLAESSSDSAGRFGEIHLAGGRYRFNVHGQRLLLTQEVNIPRGDPSHELELVVGGVNLFGRVTRNGDPVEGGFLSISSALDPAANQGKILLRTAEGQLTRGLEESTVTADVGPEGGFHVADAPHGALEVTYFPRVGEPVKRQALVPDQPRYELHLEIGGLVLRGRVVDADTGLPLESVSFRLLNDFGRTVGTATTDASGHFLISDLESGEYAAELVAEHFASKVHKPVIVQAGIPPLEIAMEPEGTGLLSTRLVREDGSAVAGILVSLLNESGRMVRSLLSDSRGIRRYEDLPAGNYFVVWADPLSGTGVSEPVAVQGGEEAHFEHVLPTGGSVEIACNWQGCGGAPVEHVAVFSTRGVEIGAYLSGVSPALRFSQDGQLALGRLSRDTYLVRVWAGNKAREAVFTVDSQLETVMLP